MKPGRNQKYYLFRNKQGKKQSNTEKTIILNRFGTILGKITQLNRGRLIHTADRLIHMAYSGAV